MTRHDPAPDPRLPRLAELSDLVQRHAVAALAANQRREAALVAEIVALRAKIGATAPSPFECAGGGAAHARWCAARIATLSSAQAQVRAARDGLARAAARAIARDQVLARLRREGSPGK